MMVHRVRHSAALLVVLACSEPGETSGTNTNWLRACSSATECGGLGCSCGRCTPTCDTDADCEAVGGICSPAETAILECSGVAAGRLCLPACTSSVDCAAGQLCYRGACAHALAPASCSAYPDALVCEDFEGGVERYRPVVTSGNVVSPVVTSTPSGERALEADVRVAPSTAYLRASFEPASIGSLSVRSWIQVPMGSSTYDHAPLAFWSEQEPAWALRLVAKGGRLEAWSYTTPLAGSAALSAGEWHCVEVDVDIAELGHIRISLDGIPVVDSAGIDTLPTGGIDALAMGSEWAGAVATMLVDRVLVSRSPVGCWK